MVRTEFPRRPSTRVLFVSQTARIATPYLDPSTRYRCYNPAEVLARRGVLADVVAQQRLTVGMAENYDAFVFHRPYGGDPNLVTCLDAIRKRGCPVVADYDDLIFAPEHALESSIYLNGVRNETQTRGIFANNYLGFKQFDRFTVSTGPLSEQILRLNPSARVEIVRNGLSEALCSSFDMRVDFTRKRASRIKVVSYLSGTASHNPDFASVVEPLSAFLSEHRDFRLSIAGPLEVPPSFQRGMFIRISHREYREFFSSIGAAYCNIAPLLPNNVFNACKSGLKFFESGIWGVPTIASPLEDFRRFADCPAMRLVQTPQEWICALERWATDSWLDDVGPLQAYCRERCMAEAPGRRLFDFLMDGGR